MRQYIGFRLNNNEYAMPILKVKEIISMPSIVMLPKSPQYIEGIANIRGSITPILNLKRLLCLNTENLEDRTNQRIIISSNGKITFGIMVDEITGIINIEETNFESHDSILKEKVSYIEGIANLDNHLITLLDVKGLIPFEETNVIEDFVNAVEVLDERNIDVVRQEQGKGEEAFVKDVHYANEFFKELGVGVDDPRHRIISHVIAFMKAISNQDYESADKLIQEIMSYGQSDLFKEVGKVTRKLHDSIRHFKEAIDPKIKNIAETEMPNAVDKLQFVIQKTEDAANKTMGIVEKYILSMDEISSHIRILNGPEDSISYLKNFKNSLEDDLTEILTAQSFQDITGQTIKKVIKLVEELEGELVNLITTFGVKIDEGKKTEVSSEKVSQEGVDDLLRGFGF